MGCSGLLQLFQALPHTLGLGLEVIQATLERFRLFPPGREPALEAERMPAAAVVLMVAVVPRTAAAVLPVTAVAAAPLPHVSHFPAAMR